MIARSLALLIVTLIAIVSMAAPASAAVDLRVEVLAVTPTSVVAGSSVTLTYRVANRGTTTAVATASKPYTDRIYLSLDMYLDAADTLLGTSHGHTVDLEPLIGRHQHTQRVTIPSGTPAGSYFVVVQADALERFAESDEANNTLAVALAVTADGGGIPPLKLPDLVVELPTLSAPEVRPGMSLDVAYRIANRGTASATGWTERLYLATDALPDAADVLLGTTHEHTVSLAPSQTHAHDQRVVIPQDTAPGLYFILIQADAGSRVTELSELNNTSAVALTVVVIPAGTYTNPLINEYLADGFILRVDDTYYLYATDGHQTYPDGREIPIWKSTDLVNWTFVRGAVMPGGPVWNQMHFWGPKVFFKAGIYYMYYTVKQKGSSHTNNMAYATSTSPEGPFTDPRLLISGRAFDGFLFEDDDGELYFYFVRSGGYRYVTRMVSPTQLDASGVISLGCCSEGPYVFKRDGVYYLLTAVGDWQHNTYREDWRTSTSPLGPFTVRGTLLKSAGEALGPGHVSLFQTPDGQDWMIYHAWDKGHTARYPFIDRLFVGPDGLSTNGPTTTPQPLPEPLDE